MPAGCQVSSFLLAHYPARVSQHWRSGNGALRTTSVARRVPRFACSVTKLQQNLKSHISFRIHKHVFRRPLHPRNVPQDVQLGLSRVFRVAIQPLRLFRCDWQHRRNGAVPYEYHATARHFRAPLCSTFESLQGHKVGCDDFDSQIY